MFLREGVTVITKGRHGVNILPFQDNRGRRGGGDGELQDARCVAIRGNTKDIQKRVLTKNRRLISEFQSQGVRGVGVGQPGRDMPMYHKHAGCSIVAEFADHRGL